MPMKKTGRSRGRPNKEPSSFGEKPNLTDTQWLALECEWRGCGEEFLKDEWPSGTAAEIVARAAGVSRQMVHNWRTGPKYRHEYRRGLVWLLIERLTRSLATGDPKDPDPKLTRPQHAALLHVFVKRNWTGSAQSPIDKKIYLSPDKYVAHLMAAGDSREPALAHDVVPRSDDQTVEEPMSTEESDPAEAGEPISTDDSNPAGFEWVKYDPDLMDK